MINDHHNLKLEEINEQETTMMKNLINKQLKKNRFQSFNIDHLTKSAKTDYKLIKLASVKNICLVELLAHKL